MKKQISKAQRKFVDFVDDLEDEAGKHGTDVDKRLKKQLKEQKARQFDVSAQYPSFCSFGIACTPAPC